MNAHVLRRLTATASLAVAALSLPGVVSAQFTTGYPAPGGNTFSSTGSSLHAPGADWRYSGFTGSAFDKLYWTFANIESPWVADHTVGAGPTGPMQFLGVNALGIASWVSNGPTKWLDDDNFQITVAPTFLNVQFKPIDAASGNPAGSPRLSTTTALEAGITTLPPSWVVFDVAANGASGFDVWFEYTIFAPIGAGNAVALGDYFDAHRDANDLLITSATGAFYSTPPVTATPEPASIGLLATGFAGLGGLGLRRRKSLNL